MKNIRGVSNQFYVGATNLLNLILLSFLYLSIFYSKTRWLLLFISVWSTRIFPQNLYTQNFKAWIPWLFNCLNTFPISPLHFIHCKFNLFNEHRNKTHLLSSDKTVLQLRSAMFSFFVPHPAPWHIFHLYVVHMSVAFSFHFHSLLTAAAIINFCAAAAMAPCVCY